MLRVLEVTLPVFALVFCGYFGQRLRMLPANAVDGINAFVFNFALPAMLFRVVSTQPARNFADPRFAAGYTLSTLALFLLIRAVVVRTSRAPTSTLRSKAIGFGLTGAHGNVGYLGVPLALEIGQQYAPTVILSIVCDIFVVIATSIALLEMERRRAANGGDASNLFVTVATSLATSPLLLAIGAGLAATLAEVRLPGSAASFVRILSGAAGPCALFAIGASLGDRPIAVSRAVKAIVATKLLVHPAIVAVVLQWVVRADPVSVSVGVFAASLPCAGNAYIIAQRYGVDVREISSAILISTFLALATVSFVIWATGLR
jgi:malonate transporter and related proteins